MNWIELTVYVILPEPAMIGTVERQAMVTFKGHPRVVVPLAQMLQQAAAVLGGRGLESQTKEEQEEASLSGEDKGDEKNDKV